jgi:hypothetical protein
MFILNLICLFHQARVGVLCQTCIALLTHPRLLAHLLEVNNLIWERSVWCKLLLCKMTTRDRKASKTSATSIVNLSWQINIIISILCTAASDPFHLAGESICELPLLIVFWGKCGGLQRSFVKITRFHVYFLNESMLWKLFFLRRMFKLVNRRVTLNWWFFMLFPWFLKSWEPHVTSEHD